MSNFFLSSAYFYNTNYSVPGLVTSTVVNFLNTTQTFLVSPQTLGDPLQGVYKTLYINAQNGKTISYGEGQTVITSDVIHFLYNNRIVCFKEDTQILTDKGYKPIQDLRTGDLVKTLLHDYKRIVMNWKREIHHSASSERIKNQLYKCSQEQYPEIFEPLILTGCHCILVDEFTDEEQKKKVIEVNGDTYITDNKYRLPACADLRASVYETPGTYTIYHFALEHDDYYMNYGIYANGLLVETCSKRFLKELSDMELIELNV